jgi:DHA2 family multidrug resistance protein-like MFS transporter
MDVADGLPVPQRYWAVLTMGIALTMAVLDSAIANVALPTMARELAVSPANSIWIVNAYQLAVTVSLFPISSLGDIFGYRRVYATGLAVFTLASLACALSDSLLMLTLARVVQGFGAAGVMGVNIALVRFIYPYRLLGRGVGYNALIVGVASAAGPTVAAAILSVASWQWLFAINVPLGVLALVLAARSLPETPRSQHRFDWLSGVLNALTFGLLITGLKGLDQSQHPSLAAAEIGGALVLGYVLVRRQLSQDAPMLPVDLLRLPIFALSVVTSVCSFGAQAMAFVALLFYFQDVIGRSQTETGLLMTPWPLAVAIVAPIAGRLADRHDPGLLGGLGLAILAVGLASLALLPEQPTIVDMALRMTLCGIGFGLFQTPNNKVLITAAPRERSGGASGIQSTARLLGQTVGAALVGLMFGLSTDHRHATVVATGVAAGLSAVAGVASSLRRFRGGTAEPS